MGLAAWYDMLVLQDACLIAQASGSDAQSLRLRDLDGHAHIWTLRPSHLGAHLLRLSHSEAQTWTRSDGQTWLLRWSYSDLDGQITQGQMLKVHHSDAHLVAHRHRYSGSDGQSLRLGDSDGHSQIQMLRLGCSLTHSLRLRHSDTQVLRYSDLEAWMIGLSHLEAQDWTLRWSDLVARMVILRLGGSAGSDTHTQTWRLEGSGAQTWRLRLEAQTQSLRYSDTEAWMVMLRLRQRLRGSDT